MPQEPPRRPSPPAAVPRATSAPSCALATVATTPRAAVAVAAAVAAVAVAAVAVAVAVAVARRRAAASLAQAWARGSY